MEKKTVVKNLEYNRKWVEKHLRSKLTQVDKQQAQNIPIGCVQTSNQCGQSIQSWLNRDPERRRLLRQLIKGHVTQKNLRLLQKFIDYTISVVGACSWVNDFWVGALPVGQQRRPRSEAHSKAIKEGHQRRREREQAVYDKMRKAKGLNKGVLGHQGS